MYILNMEDKGLNGKTSNTAAQGPGLQNTQSNNSTMEDRGASLDQPSDETIAIAAHVIYRSPGQDAYNKLDLKATNTDEEGSGEEVEIDESELPNTDYLKDIKHIKKEKRRKEKSKSKKDEK